MADFENKNAYLDSFVTMKRWLENRNAGKTFAEYFHTYGYHKIAIYGAGDLGKLLYEEIKNSEIQVSYFVDRNAEGIQFVEGIPVVTINEIPNMAEVDALIITPVGNDVAIGESLARRVPKIRTMSLREAVYEF